MPASEDPDSTPASNTSPSPKCTILPYRSKPNVRELDKLAIQHPVVRKAGKQRNKKGQRLDLKSLLQDAPDELLGSASDDVLGNIEQSVAHLGIQDNKDCTMRPNTCSDQNDNGNTAASVGFKSLEPYSNNTSLAKSEDSEVLAQTAAENVECDYDDGKEVESDAYDDDDDSDTFSLPPKLPLQSSRSRKGNSFNSPVDRKQLVGAIDGPLAPHKSTPKKSNKARQQERVERNRAEKTRQEANSRAGHGRVVGPGAGVWDRAAGGGRADR